MFYIYCSSCNKNFCKDSRKTIVFNSEHEAINFLNLFWQYALTRMMEENFLRVGEVAVASQSTAVLQIDDSIIASRPDDFVKFEDLKR